MAAGRTAVGARKAALAKGRRKRAFMMGYLGCCGSCEPREMSDDGVAVAGGFVVVVLLLPVRKSSHSCRSEHTASVHRAWHHHFPSPDLTFLFFTLHTKMAIENILILGVRHHHHHLMTATTRLLTYPSQPLALPPNPHKLPVQHKPLILIQQHCSGDSDLQISIINAVIAARVKRFVPNESSHDSLNKQLQARLPKHAERAKAINHLKNLSDASPNFGWMAVATGYTLDTKIVNDNMGVNMEWQSATFHGTGMGLFAASSLARVGQVVARLLAHWEKTKNQYIYAAGATISANQALKSVEEMTGQEFAVGSYGVEECVEEGPKWIERGYPDSGLALPERNILYDDQLNSSAPFGTYNANDMLGLAPESANSMVTEAYHRLKNLGKLGCACAT
ncbi:hypothetical protein J3E73DRAFT_426013 [Bipolaris maydis]|nr:hypothetical protein J3E73DRAFT_426013 [Bipolaris maydis]